MNGFNPHSESSSTLGQSNDQMNLNNQMNHLNNLNSSAHMTRSFFFYFKVVKGWIYVRIRNRVLSIDREQ